MTTPLHSWNLSPSEAVALQKQLAARVRSDLRLARVRCLAGTDLAYLPHSDESVAAVVVFSYPALEKVASTVVRRRIRFPYVPGLLSFREIPPLLDAFDRLTDMPDLVFVDGHGRAHPRRLGIASHLGLWLGLPTIGAAKSLLCGQFDEPGQARGQWSDLTHRGEVVGRAVRTRTGKKPVFVSTGYGLSLEECVRWTLSVSPRFRIPEPIRQAHQLAARSL